MLANFLKAAGICCCLFLLSACDSGDEAPKKPITPVRTQAIISQNLTKDVRYTATIEANSQVNLSFKVTGYVTSLLQEKDASGKDRPVQSGDIVAKNTVLAIVDDKDAANNTKQAGAQVATAQANLNKANEDYKRAQELYKSNSMTAPDYDAAKQEYETAVASLSSAKAAQKSAENDQKDYNLKAPIHGVIIQRNVDVGSLVSPSVVGFVIADTETVKIAFGVPDTMASTLKLGQNQSFTTQSIPDRIFSGTITEISAAADTNTRVFDVEVTAKNEDSSLKVGMIAALNVAKSSATQTAALIPLSAVVAAKDSKEGYAVFVTTSDGSKTIAKLTDVELGQVYGNNIAVLKGVEPSDQIIVSGATLVTDGEQVSIIP
ncbi:efflux RND transporter periplasmic adaptor subunit [Sneathiella marina]|uniref:Efflux RND transporter periplasmic adaptor subunit n=1 Tax=Sneathiella marina TaxID=2950108 RepID=A0ABY4W118_9PROT|nr:efflux RND transporter periplasmic adaptor subunit [Sneathiella marina]USG60876.1 efflux RND transporter periplasmic adaptor subunit [Sneathiella marina]